MIFSCYRSVIIGISDSSYMIGILYKAEFSAKFVGSVQLSAR